MLTAGKYILVLNGTEEEEASLNIQLFAGNGEPKLHAACALLHETKKLKAVLLLDFIQPRQVLQIDENGDRKLEKQVLADSQNASE